jgi:hypothetical protein
VHQFINLLLVADNDITNLKRYSDDNEMKNKCLYVIELVDCTLWDISTKDEEFAFFIDNKPSYAIKQINSEGPDF